MDASLKIQWEYGRESFETLDKSEFDRLLREKQFTAGPLIGEPSQWMREFGPYSPEQVAFGQLIDGRFVCCDITAEADGGE